MNTLKCNQCQHYDVIVSGKTKFPKHGWCAIKSIYPAKEGVGQVFPPGVKRVADPSTPAKPEIVEGEGVVTMCSMVSPK